MNLILVDLDTMRADRLGCYGYSARPTSARLDSLMNERGFFLFQRAYSSAPWTLPATARILTGRFLSNRPWESSEIGVLPGFDTLAETLRSRGYYCAAFTGGSQLRKIGLERGFHEYYWSSGFGKVEATFPPAEEWLRNESPTPFFLFLHTYEPHHPYTRGEFCASLSRGRLGDLTAGEDLLPRMLTSGTAPMSEDERHYVDAAYDGGIRVSCDATADFLAVLDELGLWKNTIVIILSDHGEELWDHSAVYAKHGHSLYSELIDVPFAIYCPHRCDAGLVRIAEPVGVMDAMPTVLQLIDGAVHDQYDGESLVPLLEGRARPRRRPIVASNWRIELQRPPKFALISGDWKLIDNTRSRREWNDINKGRNERALSVPYPDPHHPFQMELYATREDPEELDNRAHLEGARVEEMSGALDRALELTGLSVALDEYGRDQKGDHLSGGGLSADLEAQLRSMGYLQ